MAGSASLFAVGAVAICGLPPLNGFESELLIYVGLLRVAGDGRDGLWSAAPLAVPVLALAGALALACFVKAFGTVFLGPPRSAEAAQAHESAPSMLLAMGLLALGCVGIGALPVLVMPALDRVVQSWLPAEPPPPSLPELVPWSAVMAVNAVLVAGVVTAALWLRGHARARPLAQTVTWDCGYARPGPSMAYTASSFAQILVGLHAWLLRPRATGAVAKQAFPAPLAFHSRVPEPVMEGALLPAWAGFRRALAPLRALQQGRIQGYLTTILLTLCVLLAALFPLDDLLRRLLGW
jgi:hydrogenase-4 component B